MSKLLESRLVEFEPAAYVTGLPHRVNLFEGEALRPAVVMIHGRHGDERVPWIFSKTIPDGMLLVSPRAIEFEPETDDHEIGYSWITMPKTGWPTFDVFDDAIDALHEFVIGLPEIYPIDKNRLYLLGFSQGAAAAITYALRYPDMVQGIASLVGFSPDPPAGMLDEQPLKGKPIFMAVGERDDRIPIELARHTKKILEDAGAVLSYDEYNVGHKLNLQGMKDLTNWWQSIL